MRRWTRVSVAMIAAAALTLTAAPAFAAPATPAASVFTATSNAAVTGNEWTTPTTVKVGQIPARTSVIPFDEVAEAKANPTLHTAERASGNARLLNGTWQFNYVSKPADKPNISGVTEIPSSGYKDIPVPSSWQVAGQYAGALGTDFPIYNNQDYAWQAVGGEITRNVGDFEAAQAPTDYNPVGTYFRELELTAEDIADNRLILSFLGVEAGFYLYVNGDVVGYGEDSWSTSEFDISDYVHAGTNLIGVQVYRWTTGTFIENQDAINYSGIHRDVYLTVQPEVSIFDYNVETVFDGGDYSSSRLEVDVDVASTDSAAATRTVKAHLYDAAGQQVGDVLTGTVDVAAGATATVGLTATVANPALWSAEFPNLYTLVLELADDSGETIQAVGKRIGFREIRVANAGTSNSTSHMVINGQNIELYGTNRSESDAAYGHHVPYETIVKDAVNLKTLNINAVRTSHYPPDPHLIDLADEYGLYVMDEVNNESHNGREGIKIPEASKIDASLTGRVFPGNDARYTTALLQRTESVVKRDRSHASVIMYSLGNESGNGPNYDSMIDVIRDLDGDKLIHYQGDNGNPRLDVVGSFYPEYSRANTSTATKPGILAEYQHAMGNTGGELDEYIKVFEGSYRQQGGFIWEYNDHTALTLIPGSDTSDGVQRDELFYGIDGSWPQVSGDGNFLADGFIAPDRSIKPMGDEIRAQYQDIKFTQTDEQRAAHQVTVKNLNRFKNVNDYALTWSLLEDGVAVQTGTYTDAEADLAPATGTVAGGSTKVLTVPYTLGTPRAGAEYQVRLEYALKSDTAYADAGYVQGSGQFATDDRGADVTVALDDLPTVETDKTTGDKVTVTGQTPDAEDFTVVIDKTTGLLTTYRVDGRELISKAPVGSFFRAETDQNAGVKGYAATLANAELYDGWLDQGEELEDVAVRVVDSTPGVTKVFVDATLENGSLYETAYSIHGDGSITVEATLTPSASAPAQLGEYGQMLQVPAEFENMQWYGRGPGETYWDRKAGNNIGLWSSTVTDRYFPYMRIQETGNATDVRWLALTDDDGNGLLASIDYGEGYSGTPLEAVALHHTPEQLSTFNTKSLFPYQAESTDDVVLRLLTHQKGVGNPTWGAEPIAAVINKTDTALLSYSYTLKPLSAGDDPTAESKTIYEELAIPSLTAIEVDGLAVDGFAPETLTYDYTFPAYYPEGGVPVVTATAPEGFDVTVEQPTGVPGVAKIHVGNEGNQVTYTVNIAYREAALPTLPLTDLIEVPSLNGSGVIAVDRTDAGDLLYAFSGYRGIYEDKNISGNPLKTFTQREAVGGFGGNSFQLIDVDISDKEAVSFSGLGGIDGDKGTNATSSVIFEVWGHKDVDQLTSAYYTPMNPGAAGAGTVVSTGWTKLSNSALIKYAADHTFDDVPLTYVDGNGQTQRYEALRLVVNANGSNSHDQVVWGEPRIAVELPGDPALTAVELDGAPLADFTADVHDYTVVLSSAAKTPKITAEYDEGIFVDVKQAAGVPGTATVRAGTETYRISFERAAAPAGQQAYLSDFLPDEIAVGSDQSTVLNGNLLYAYSGTDGITVDQSQGGAPLVLRKSGQGTDAVTTQYAHGIAGGAHQVLDVDVSARDALRFTADVGIDWTLQPDGEGDGDGPAVTFQVWAAKDASTLTNGVYADMAPTPAGGTLVAEGWTKLGESPVLSNHGYSGSAQTQKDLHRFDLDLTYVDEDGARRSYEAIRLVADPAGDGGDRVVWGDPRLTFVGDAIAEPVNMIRLTSTMGESTASVGYLLETPATGETIRSVGAAYDEHNRLIGLSETPLRTNDGNQDGDLPMTLPDGVAADSLAYLLISGDGSLRPITDAWRADAVTSTNPFQHTALRTVLAADAPQFDVAMDDETKDVTLSGTGFPPGAVLVIEARAADVTGIDHIAFVTVDGRGVLDYTYRSNSASLDGITVRVGGQGLESALAFPKQVASVVVSGDGVADGAVTLERGAALDLAADVQPADAPDRSVTWSTNAGDIVGVTAEGRVSALAVGSAVITATANDGSGAAGSVTVTVIEAELPPLVVTVTPSVRCTLGKATLVVQVTNGDAVPVALDVQTPYGTKQVAALAPGKGAAYTFSTRLGQIPAGEGSVVAKASVGGKDVTTTVPFTYPAANCG